MFSLENEHDFHELEFLEKNVECLDEADGVSAAVIAIEKDSQSDLAKYVKSGGKKTIERILRREKVSSSWGRHTNKVKSSTSMTNEIPALLSFEAAETSGVKHIDDKMIHKFEKALCKVSGKDCVEILKYSNLQIIARFEGTDAYQEFGKRYINGEFEEINGFRLIEVKAVSVANQYPCHLEVSCSPSDGPKLQADFSSFFVSYCSRFPCISIKETTQRAVCSNSPTGTEETVPAIDLMMRFMSKAQSNAHKFIQAVKMAEYEWKEFPLPKELSESGQMFFKSSNIPGMSISVQQCSPFAGIKIMLFVNKNIDEMEKFYSVIVGKSPLVVDKIEEGLRYMTYSLSTKLELQLVLHPKLKPSHSKYVQLCFSINDVNNILPRIPGGAHNVGGKHWQVTDPDGNSLILYSLLKQ